MARSSQPAPCATVIEFASERLRRSQAAASTPAAPGPAGAADDDSVMLLTDALMLLFHLRADGGSPQVCRELEQAVRIAVALRPMAETVDVSAGAWEVIAAVDLREAVASCQARFAAEWQDEGPTQ